MLISIDDPAFVDDLRAHYERSGFDARNVGETAVDITLRDAPSREQEHREIVMHLRVWQATHPGRQARVI